MSIYPERRFVNLILLAVVFLASCAQHQDVIIPTATQEVAATATNTPTETITPLPDLDVDLLAFIQNDNIEYSQNTIILNNLENSDWSGTVSGPFPIDKVFQLKIQYSMEGDFGGITFYGNMKTPESASLPRLVIGPAGKIGFIDDSTGINQDFDIPIRNGEIFLLNFLDPQGKEFDVISEAGKIVQHFDVTKDLTDIALPKGLFPNGEFFFDLQTAPKSKLIVSQLSLQVSPDGIYSAAIDTKCSLSVGDEEIVINNETLRAKGLKNWPDTVMGVWRDNNEYHFLSANPMDSGYLQFSAIATGTMDDPVANSVISKIPIQNTKDSFGYIGGGPVYRDPKTGILLMFYDTEKYPAGSSAVHNTTGMAKSTDNGVTWTDLGVILDTEFPGWGDWNVGTGNGPFVINGDYFYVYFSDVLTANPRLDIGTSVARAKVEDVMNAAINENTVVPWLKYYQGQWNQPGISGKSSPIEIGNPQSTTFDVSFNEYLGRYIKVDSSPRGNSYGLYLSESLNGINWTFRVPLGESTGYKLYPTIIGLGSDPKITGDKFYVYYLYTPNWFEEDAHAHTFLARRLINCEGK